MAHDGCVLILRGYEAGDVEAMYALDVRCFAPEFKFSRSAMKRFAEAKKARVVVAEDNGAVVGFCIVHVERDGLAYVVTLGCCAGGEAAGCGSRVDDAG